MFLTKASSRNTIGLERGNNWGCYYFLFGNKFVKLFVTYSPSHRHAGAAVINI